MTDISSILGLVFVTNSGNQYGVIRKIQFLENHPVTAIGLHHIADDECGNAFARKDDGSIVFWDHETDELAALAASWDEFVSGCVAPGPAKQSDEGVSSVWIDPEFAREQGIDVSPGGRPKTRKKE